MIQTRENELKQEAWLKVSQRLQNKGNWTQDIGVIEILYVPDKLLITGVEYNLPNGVGVDVLVEIILKEIIDQVDPKYVEISIKTDLGSGILITHGKDDGWKQVATFRFSEPRL